MKFVPADKLKVGMRLAKPIFNKNGVMLYERDSKLTSQGISSIRNFGLIGIYILEPAEPLPPMTEEDREFERFQTMSVFTLQEILLSIRKGKQSPALLTLANEILRIFGKYKGKITFMQNLRSMQDTVYKHSLNTAILAAAISGKMNVTPITQQNIVLAALLHDIGMLDVSMAILQKPEEEYTEEDQKVINQCLENGYRLIRENCDLEAAVMKNISYLLREIREMKLPLDKIENRTKDLEVDILTVSYCFDTLTAMKYGEEPKSDIGAYRYLRHPRNRMNQQVVTAMTWAINIVPAGAAVQFANGKKGIVLTENETDILRPFILSFEDNQIYNLANGKTYEEYQITDVIKTLDNRYVMVDSYKKYLDNLANGIAK